MRTEAKVYPGFELIPKKQEIDKSDKAWPNWQSLSGGQGYNSIDEYGRREPGTNDLINSVRDIVYACISLIANNLSQHRLKLYIDAPKGHNLKTRKLDVKARMHLKTRILDNNIEEVLDHPALDLIYKNNSEHNFLELMGNTIFAMEACGNAYWLKSRDSFGVVDKLTYLPVDRMFAQRDEQTGIIIYYKFGLGNDQVVFKCKDIIHLRFCSLNDPYGLGMPPLRACYERVLISFQQAGYLSTTLRNNARPDAVISPSATTNGYSLGISETQRLQKEFNQIYKLAGAGGTLVLSDSMELTPLSWSPVDMGLDQLYKTLKTSICNSFHIPPDLFETGASSNRATRESAMFSFANDCLKPRLSYIVEKLTEKLAAEFDDRYFFYSDSIVPADKDYDLKLYETLLKTGVITRDEWREVLGMDSVEWAKEPLIPTGYTTQEQIQIQNQAALPEPAPEPAPMPVPQQSMDDKVKLATTLTAMAEAVKAGQLPPESAVAIASVLGVSPEAAKTLFPEPEKPEPAPIAPQIAQDAPQAPPEPKTDTQDNQDDEGLQQGREKAHKGRKVVPFQPVEEDKELTLAIKTFFRRLSWEVDEGIKAFQNISTKSPEDEPPLFNPEAAAQDLFDLTIPRIRILYETAANIVSSHFETGNSLFKVVQPKLKEATESACMEFAQSTIQTTSLEIEDAKQAIRKEISEGMEAGEYKNALRNRVKTVFHAADNERAYLISHTESVRASAAASLLVAKESGVVTGKQWLADSNCCDECKAVDGQVVGLEDNYAVVGEGPYSHIQHPPMHPACKCTQLFVLGD